MRIDVLTLFPEAVKAVLDISIPGRAQERGHWQLGCHQIRDYTRNKQKQVDDYPYGGGLGMVMQADPLYNAWAFATDTYGKGRTILMSPRGAVFSQDKAKELAANHEHLILVCGRYEGVDQRFIDECVDEELSIGDYVLTGGEIAAAAVCDAVCRLIPGVLADERAFETESHWDGLLEHPHYTRPEVWRDRPVPKVLLSGNHAAIEVWRREQSLAVTKERRPDLLETK